MVTKEYIIRFQNIETSMSTQIKISKKEYDKQYKYLMSQIEETKEDECPMEHTTYNDDLEKITQQRDYFTVACADTVLIKRECKPGYQFIR